MGKLTLLTIFILAVAASLWLAFGTHMHEDHAEITGGKIGERYFGIQDTEEHKIVHFDLVDPECAPEEMLTKILYGYHLILDTKKYAPAYAGNTLSCNNCHFNGGNSLGGKNRGISLVGVTAIYPRFSKRDNREISLAERINNCFKRSLNGKPPPFDSLEMESLINYFAWISHELDDAPMLPWLGLPEIKSTHVPDIKNGKRLYHVTCSICHGVNGEGTGPEGLQDIPPLWGDNSFNDGAGMNTLKTLSSFVWLNMPYGQPVLSQEEALDIAAFIISQPRPHFTP